MSDFRTQIRTAILGYLKEQGHLNVTETRGQYKISLRSLHGPPFVLFGIIKIGNVQVECCREERHGSSKSRGSRRGSMQTLYKIDLADPALFDVIEKFVKEIKD